MPEYKAVETGRPRKRKADKIKRDQYGRYVLPDPESGKTQSWTRVTTIAGAIKDRYALELWSQRNVAWGIGQRKDLYARAAACKQDDDETLGEIVDQALGAAATQSGAILGSALHEFTERTDAGERLDNIPEPYDRDVEVYREAVAAAGLQVAAGWIERTVIIPEIGAVGTLDRVYTTAEWLVPRIGDLKTGQADEEKFLKYGVDIPLQLAMYAHASHWWDFENEQWVEMPPIDQQVATVVHLPAGENRCTVYDCNIVAGWATVELATDLRAWRKRDDLFEIVPIFEEVGGDECGDVEPGDQSLPAAEEPVSGPEFNRLRNAVDAIREHADAKAMLSKLWDRDAVPVFSKGGPRTASQARFVRTWVDTVESEFPEVFEPDESRDDPDAQEATDESPAEDAATYGKRFAWLKRRVDTIKAADGEVDSLTPKGRLASLWPKDVPTFPKGGPRDLGEVSTIVAICELVEMAHELPFGEPDPTAPKPEPGSLSQRKRGK